MSSQSRSLLILVTLFAIPAVFATGDELPEKVAGYLAQTNAEAIIPLLNNDKKPRLELVFGAMRRPIRVGMLGTIQEYRALQIIDDESLRADLSWTEPTKFKIQGALGNEYFDLAIATQSNVIVTGLSTRGQVDGQKYAIKPPGVFEVVDTRKYVTVDGGTQTVFVLRPFDIEPYRKTFEDAVGPRKDAAAARVKRAELEAADLKNDGEIKALTERMKEIDAKLRRKWRDPTGEFTTVARLVSFDRDVGIVVLRKDDDTEIKLNIAKLSTEDRKWIAKEGKQLVNAYAFLKASVAEKQPK